MKSSYKRLGDFIKEINIKNSDLKIKNLVGVSIEKTLIKSVANTIGTDMSTYKIIKKNQLACKLMSVGRDEKLPVDLYTDENPSIISAAYYVFEPVSSDILLPEYLKMWLFRKETDRYVGYVSGGDVRGGISWETFSEMPIKVPTIEKQQEIIKEYNIIQNRITLNNQLIAKLEETAQTIYKQWFVDFEFPISDTEALEVIEKQKGYKSSGGKMVWCEELDKEVPGGWNVGTLSELSQMIDGDRGSNYPNSNDFFENEYCLFLNASNVTKSGFNFSKCQFINKEKDELLRKGKLQINDIVLTSRGTVGNLAFFSDKIRYKNIRINSGMLIIRPKIEASYLFSMLNSFEFGKAIENYISGSAVPQLPIKDLSVIKILIPNKLVMNNFSKIGLSLFREIDIIKNQNQKLEELKELLLGRMVREN
ncbi:MULTISPECIES: restriction endonuclease subunit S [Flavobacterium]|uniref:Type I restriction modification DNA specificity domain-containing protein n=1 Tax=Flavobacterium hankyongi TaxID=1176532 RepID=A0ABP8ZU43_9FLAO|nr:restriction endonuclease subunit S [Flavobacterium sp. N1846]